MVPPLLSRTSQAWPASVVTATPSTGPSATGPAAAPAAGCGTAARTPPAAAGLRAHGGYFSVAGSATSISPVATS
jgi:hypothetical protein